MASIQLRQADRVELTVLVDNIADLLLKDTDTVKRLRVLPPQAPLAEHGLSFLISVYVSGEKHTLLMDGGISGTCLMHNAELLQISKASMSGAIHHAVQDVESVILSHGHFDHFGGLPIFLESSKKKLLTIVHPGAFVERRRKLGPDQYSPMPILQEEMLVRAGADLDFRREASTVASNLILISGQVVRRTAFEKGSPTLEAKVDGRWAIDAFDDDQALAIDLKGKGLIIIGGCCHAGIINTINHICRVLGKKKVHAVFGGFHLSNAEQAAIVQTVQQMQQINPELVVPMHCTGWQATHTFAATMPDQFIRNSVGTTYVLEGKQTPPLV